MAGAPALLQAYRTVVDLFDGTSLTPSERQVVLLTTNSIADIPLDQAFARAAWSSAA